MPVVQLHSCLQVDLKWRRQTAHPATPGSKPGQAYQNHRANSMRWQTGKAEEANVLGKGIASKREESRRRAAGLWSGGRVDGALCRWSGGWTAPGR